MASLDNGLKAKVKPQLFTYFLVLDMEATYDDIVKLQPQLTGILQNMVDGQKHLEEVLKDLKIWMNENKLFEEEHSFAFVTCGDWDVKKMLPSQCQHVNLPYDKCFKKWINIKKSFAEVTTVYPKGMMHMVKELNIPHEGRHHSGIDDCKNIGNILIELIRRGHVFNITGKLS